MNIEGVSVDQFCLHYIQRSYMRCNIYYSYHNSTHLYPSFDFMIIMTFMRKNE